MGVVHIDQTRCATVRVAQEQNRSLRSARRIDSAPSMPTRSANPASVSSSSACNDTPPSARRCRTNAARSTNTGSPPIGSSVLPTLPLANPVPWRRHAHHTVHRNRDRTYPTASPCLSTRDGHPRAPLPHPCPPCPARGGRLLRRPESRHSGSETSALGHPRFIEPIQPYPHDTLLSTRKGCP